MEAPLNLLVGKLAQLIENETALVSNFKQHFQWLNMRLNILRATMKCAEENDRHNDSVQQWIEDGYSMHQAIPHDTHTLCCGPYPHLTFFCYKMGRKIRVIKERLKSIMETSNELKLIRDVASFQTGTSASTVQAGGKWEKSSMMEYGSFPVAVDIKVGDIIERLDDPAVQVLVVVGMGGIGKTFLLQHVYNNDKVQHMFEDSVSVSKTYSLQQLQRDLAHRLKLNNPATSGISCNLAAEDIHQMPLLSPEDSWKLFFAHAFSSSHKNSPPAQIEMLAREMENECGSLPLAIKRESKLHQLKEVGGANPHDPILQILKLSYYWLPSFLKPCFAYFSFFAEEKVMDCEYW